MQADAPINFTDELYSSCKEIRTFHKSVDEVIGENDKNALAEQKKLDDAARAEQEASARRTRAGRGRGRASRSADAPPAGETRPIPQTNGEASPLTSIDDEIATFFETATKQLEDGKTSMAIRPGLRTKFVTLETTCNKLALAGRGLDPSLNEDDLDFLRQLRSSTRFAQGELRTILTRLKEGKLVVEPGETRGLPIPEFSGVGGGAIADRALQGLADFIVKRAKEEAIIAIQEQFKRRLCGDEAPAMAKSLLPETCRVLQSLDATLSLRSMGTSLHAAAVADLQQLPDVVMAYGIATAPTTIRLEQDHKATLLAISTLGRTQLLAKFKPRVTSKKLSELSTLSVAELRKMLEDYETAVYEKALVSVDELEAALTLGRLGYVFYREAKRGRDAIDIASAIHSMPAVACERASEAGDTSCARAMTVVRRASVLVHTLSDKDLRDILFAATRDDIGALVIGGMLEAERIFQSSPINARAEVEFKFPLEQINGTLKLATSVRHSMSRFGAAKAIIDGLNGQPDDGIPAPTDEERRERIAEVIILCAEGMAELSKVLVSHQEEAVQTKVETTMDDFIAIAELSGSLIVEDWGGAALTSITLLERIEGNDEFKKHIQAFLPLVVEIANAKSSTEVATAIEAAAAPAGSYRTKYQHSTLSLNAFVGPAIGGEYLTRGNSSGWSGAFAGFAPVGLHAAVPFGRGKDGGRWMHVGGMLSIIDIGALTTYRFKTELENDETTSTTEHSAEVGFAQVFSPGAFLTLGIARTPLVVGGGLSMSPRLREIQVDGQTLDANALRLMAFIAIDITLYQFR